MVRKDNLNEEYSHLTFDLLKGKQSVRATFRLPSTAIHLLSIAANQLGIKQKSLFDQLVEDKGVLQYLAKNAKEQKISDKKRLQKTYVLSRQSLAVIDDVAEKNNLPRDHLVELSINRLRPVINAEQKKQKIRRSLMKEMDAFFSHGKDIYAKSSTLLDQNDPFMEILKPLIDNCEKRMSDLDDLIQRLQFNNSVQTLDHEEDDAIRHQTDVSSSA